MSLSFYRSIARNPIIRSQHTYPQRLRETTHCPGTTPRSTLCLPPACHRQIRLRLFRVMESADSSRPATALDTSADLAACATDTDILPTATDDLRWRRLAWAVLGLAAI